MGFGETWWWVDFVESELWFGLAGWPTAVSWFRGSGTGDVGYG